MLMAQGRNAKLMKSNCEKVGFEGHGVTMQTNGERPSWPPNFLAYL